MWGALASTTLAYGFSVQEDAVLEWATVWSFLIASLAFLKLARDDRDELPWFSVCLALFCLFVALEEISWGQRLLGYRPPVYFLENNFQQEFNLHNLVATSARKWALKGILAGYGVLLPILASWPPTRRLLDRLRIEAPPLWLAPGFLAALLAYEAYPWKYTGELVELTMGSLFLFVALSALESRGDAHQWMRPLRVSAVVVALGFLSTILISTLRSGDPGNIEAARTEVEALAFDLQTLAIQGDLPTKCGLHRRVYTWVSREEEERLLSGRFARLTTQGLPTERADYFLDPWNMPFWLRHRCEDGVERLTVYSFGPNRQRDSSAEALLGDDIGIEIERPQEPEESPDSQSGSEMTSPG